MSKVLFFLLGLFFGFIVASDVAAKKVKNAKEEYEVRLLQKDIEREEMRSQMLTEWTADINKFSERLHGKPKQ